MLGTVGVLRYGEAAGELATSSHTADAQVRSIYRTLQVRHRGGAMAKAVQESLVCPSAERLALGPLRFPAGLRATPACETKKLTRPPENSIRL